MSRDDAGLAEGRRHNETWEVVARGPRHSLPEFNDARQSTYKRHWVILGQPRARVLGSQQPAWRNPPPGGFGTIRIYNAGLGAGRKVQQYM